MDRRDRTLEVQADQLAEEALRELGDIPLDAVDEYAEQCDYAGCYPWLADVICAHLPDSALLNTVQGGDMADDADFFSC
jgi:hypothetical protein